MNVLLVASGAAVGSGFLLLIEWAITQGLSRLATNRHPVLASKIKRGVIKHAITAVLGLVALYMVAHAMGWVPPSPPPCAPGECEPERP